MVDETNSGGASTGAAAGTTPPADPGKTQDPPDGGDSGDWFEKLPPEAQDEVKKLRSEAAYRRKTAKEAEAKAAQLQAKIEAEEAEKLKKQGEYQKLYEGEQEKYKGLQARLVEQEMKIHAQKAGIIDLEVAKLIPTDSVRINESGEIVGAEEAVANFKQVRAHLFQNPAAAAAPPPPKTTSAGNEPPKPGPAATAKSVLELSDAEYKKQKASWLRS